MNITAFRAAALMSSALALTLIAPVAHAQDQGATPGAAATPAAPETHADADIIVTGSRVRGVAPIGSPVVAMSNADIAQAGRVTLQQAIQDLPQVFNLGVSEGSRGQTGGAGNIVYGNSINLRGIGPNATLIIVDGHRVTNNGRSIDPRSCRRWVSSGWKWWPTAPRPSMVRMRWRAWSTSSRVAISMVWRWWRAAAFPMMASTAKRRWAPLSATSSTMASSPGL
jgi:hypothetical protein